MSHLLYLLKKTWNERKIWGINDVRLGKSPIINCYTITIYDFVTFLSRRNSMYECDATAKVKFIAYFIPSQRVFFLNSRIVQVKRPTLITWGPWICNLNWLHGSHSSGTEIIVSGLLTFENWPLLPHLILVDLNRCAHQTCKQFNWIKQHLTSFGGWHFDIGCD